MDTDDKVVLSPAEDKISSEIKAEETLDQITATVKEPVEILSVQVVKEAEDVPKPINLNENNEDGTLVNNDEVGRRNEQILIDTASEIVLEGPFLSENSNTGFTDPENRPDSDLLEQKNDSENLEHISDDIEALNPIDSHIAENEQMDRTIKGIMETNEETKNPSITVETNDNIQNSSIEKETSNSTTGLSMLAQYGSEDEESSKSDNESVIEVPTSVQDYRNKVVEIYSDSDSDSSSSDSDGEYLNKLRKTIEKRIDVDDDDEDEDDEDKNSVKSGMRRKPQTKIKAKGELQLEDLPPIQDLQITVPEEECIVLGKIHSIVDQLVLVSALPDSLLVDLDTVLFLDKGQRVLGEVFDVLGQVSDPLYCVRFNSNEQINEKKIQVNDTVYLAPKTPYTQYIILSNIMKQKGSDASWENDIEPPPRFLDYSDDEEQQQARRQLRNKDRPVDHDDPQKRSRRESEEPQVSFHNKSYNNAHSRSRNYKTNMNNNGLEHRGVNARQRTHYNNNSHYRNPPQIPLNHNPSSWHSNYYPHAAYAGLPPANVPPYAGGFQRMPAPQYPQVPPYAMGMAYPVPPPPLQTQQHITPVNNHPAEHQQYIPSSAFSMRPPSIPGHYDMSSLPPGSQ